MKKIVETTLLEFEKSAFLIDLIKHDSGKLYIEISQTIASDIRTPQTLKINASIVSDLIKVLEKYHGKASASHDYQKENLIDADQQKILERYLKGINIKELALQFEQSEDIIEMVLRNKGAKIVSNDLPKKRFWKTKKRDR